MHMKNKVVERHLIIIGIFVVLSILIMPTVLSNTFDDTNDGNIPYKESIDFEDPNLSVERAAMIHNEIVEDLKYRYQSKSGNEFYMDLSHNFDKYLAKYFPDSKVDGSDIFRNLPGGSKRFIIYHSSATIELFYSDFIYTVDKLSENELISSVVAASTKSIIFDFYDNGYSPEIEKSIEGLTIWTDLHGSELDKVLVGTLHGSYSKNSEIKSTIGVVLSDVVGAATGVPKGGWVGALIGAAASSATTALTPVIEDLIDEGDDDGLPWYNCWPLPYPPSCWPISCCHMVSDCSNCY